MIFIEDYICIQNSRIIFDFNQIFKVKIVVWGCNTILNGIMWIQKQYLRSLNTITHQSRVYLISSENIWKI